MPIGKLSVGNKSGDRYGSPSGTKMSHVYWVKGCLLHEGQCHGTEQGHLAPHSHFTYLNKTNFVSEGSLANMTWTTRTSAQD